MIQAGTHPYSPLRPADPRRGHPYRGGVRLDKPHDRNATGVTHIRHH